MDAIDGDRGQDLEQELLDRRVQMLGLDAAMDTVVPHLAYRQAHVARTALDQTGVGTGPPVIVPSVENPCGESDSAAAPAAAPLRGLPRQAVGSGSRNFAPGPCSTARGPHKVRGGVRW